jgi:hypothetical protein
MTAIAIWYNNEIVTNPALWVAADSRIGSEDDSALLEDGSKIFPLPVICRSPDPDNEGFFSRVMYSHTYGYCFAGSTLMGQNAYLAIAPLLTQLITTGTDIPALKDVAEFARKHLDLTFSQYRERVGPASRFEVAIFGWCTKTSQLATFHFFPKIVGDVYRMTCEPHENMDTNNFVYLGDKKEYFSEEIAAAFRGESIPGRLLSRIPRYIIEDHIKDDSFPTIGGDIQFATTDKFGFQPFMLAKPRVLGQPWVYFSYLGRELTNDLTVVGPAFVGTPGIT